MKIKKNIAISESGFIFVPNTGDSYTLNPVAADIIHAINENKTINDIQTIIETKYDVDPVIFEKDFHEFIQQLKQYQLIENDKNN